MSSHSERGNPENTLESLDQAALLGCNVVEIDLRRTLDGQIVLNHDGIMERLTDGAGELETSYYGDLEPGNKRQKLLSYFEYTPPGARDHGVADRAE